MREGRHLAAIMFVDMVGYSALMQDSEPRAIALVRELWDLVRPILARHGGREVDLAGDGMLMEFSGALAAARCALDLHAALRRRNRERPDAAALRIRAGLHLGDIEHRDGRVYGDGVNIAARVLALAPPGSLAFTPHVRDQLLNALERAPEPLGRKTLKNIKGAIELWCLPGPDCTAAELAAARTEAAADGAQRRWRFANATFDERTLELTVNGTAVDLEKKSIDVLTFLLHHADEVVTKDELIEGAWPGRVISDSALTTCIAKLRAALGDDAQTLIKTVHGFGYRFAVPVDVETQSAPELPRFTFREGDHLPQRPLWSLLRRLGGGGHGEVWLARHDKTKEERVYKFALAPEHLASLKREITLSRVLNDAHGARACFVRVLDWNLDQAPYFIECEYSRGGSLVDWAQAQGGIGNVPLATRIEIATQAAEALALAHSVGVLHKDFKPANILIEPEPFKAKLTDFGSGGVLDPERLAELGITRMGFTKAVLQTADSGTALYLAPEVIAGQPWTSKADLYALGLVLFQLVVGDFRRTLAPGWEKDVPDDLLREDITAAASGNPAHRPSDAAALAQRLRALGSRRHQRDVQALEARKAEKRRTWFWRRMWAYGFAAVGFAVFCYWFMEELVLAHTLGNAYGAIFKLADRYEREHKFGNAEELVRTIVNAEENRPYRFGPWQSFFLIGAEERLAALYAKDGKLEGAIDTYRKVLALPRTLMHDDLGEAEDRSRLGRLLEQAGRKAEARDEFSRAAELFDQGLKESQGSGVFAASRLERDAQENAEHLRNVSQPTISAPSSPAPAPAGNSREPSANSAKP